MIECITQYICYHEKGAMNYMQSCETFLYMRLMISAVNLNIPIKAKNEIFPHFLTCL